MSWDLASNSAGTTSQETGGKTNFTKFEFGNTELRVLDKTPFMRWSHWMPQYQRRITCPGMECPICKLNKKLKANRQNELYDNSRQWSLNVWNYTTGRHEVNEQGLKFMEELRLMFEELNGDVTNGKLKITKRKGSDGKAVWRMDVAEIGAAEPEVQSARLVDRGEYFKPLTVEQIEKLINTQTPTKEYFAKVVTGNDEGSGPELLASDTNAKRTEGIGEEVQFETE